MRRGNYLVGDRYEKYRINDLLKRRAPHGIVVPTFIDHCNELAETLNTRRARTVDDFDYHLCEYLDEFNEELEHRITDRPFSTIENCYENDLPFEMPYLLDVEEAMDYFRKYLCQLDLIPVPRYIQVCPGTPGSVMLLRA